MQNDLARRAARAMPVGILGLLLLHFVAFGVLLLVGIFVVHTVVKVLIVELLVCTVKLSHANAEPQHDVFVLHQWSTVLY